jgi:hypothetical protein
MKTMRVIINRSPGPRTPNRATVTTKGMSDRWWALDFLLYILPNVTQRPLEHRLATPHCLRAAQAGTAAASLPLGDH